MSTGVSIVAFLTIDSDGHVQEPWDLWERYLPEAMRSRVSTHETDWKTLFVMDGVQMPPRGPYEESIKNMSARTEDRYQFAEADRYSAASQLQAMDVEGIDAAVIFPTHGLVIQGVDGVDPALTTAMSRAYNDWLAAEFIGEGKGRLAGMAMVDARDVDGAVKETRRAIEELGLIGIFLRPNPVGGRPWHHPDYEPLWSTVAELDGSVGFHEGGAVRLPQIGPDRFSHHPLWHVCTHPMEQQMAMLGIVMGGVVERHPSLRFAFLECGAGWLPYWMWRMDEKFEEEHAELSITMKPSDYIRRQCFVSIDSDEEPGVYAIETLDDRHVVWGSDYPHHDGKYPVARKTLTALPGMTPARQQSVLQDAPLELFGARLRAQLS